MESEIMNTLLLMLDFIFHSIFHLLFEMFRAFLLVFALRIAFFMLSIVADFIRRHQLFLKQQNEMIQELQTLVLMNANRCVENRIDRRDLMNITHHAWSKFVNHANDIHIDAQKVHGLLDEDLASGSDDDSKEMQMSKTLQPKIEHSTIVNDQKQRDLNHALSRIRRLELICREKDDCIADMPVVRMITDRGFIPNRSFVSDSEKVAASPCTFLKLGVEFDSHVEFHQSDIDSIELLSSAGKRNQHDFETTMAPCTLINQSNIILQDEISKTTMHNMMSFLDTDEQGMIYCSARTAAMDSPINYAEEHMLSTIRSIIDGMIRIVELWPNDKAYFYHLQMDQNSAFGSQLPVFHEQEIQIECLTKENHNLGKEADPFHPSIESLIATLESERRENSKLKMELVVENDQLKQHIRKLEHVSENERFYNGLQETLNDKLEQQRQEIEMLEEIVATKTRESKSLNQNDCLLDAEATRLQSEVAHTKQQVSEFEGTINILTHENNALRSERDLALKHVKEVDDMHFKMSSSVNILESKYEDEKMQLKEETSKIIKQMHTELLVEKGVADQLSIEFQKCQKQIAHLQKSTKAEINEKDQELTALKEKLCNQSNSVEEMNALRKSVSELKFYRELAEAKIESLEEKLRSNNSSVANENNVLRDKVSKALKDHMIITQRNEDLQGKVQFMQERMEVLAHDRRRLHEDIQNLKGSIRVYCRIRRSKSKTLSSSTSNQYSISERSITLNRRETTLLKGKVSQSREVLMNRVFDSNSSQSQVYGEISELITSFIDGDNVSLICYGASASGKSYTMFGNTALSVDDRGLGPRAMEQLFSIIHNDNQWISEVEVSVIEVHNNKLIDLLNEASKNEVKALKIVDCKQSFDKVQGLTRVSVQNADHVQTIWNTAHQRRSISSTKINEQSSRSHGIFQIRLKRTSIVDQITTESCLSLVDLAGSEDCRKTKTFGDEFKESTFINSNLTTLGRCIRAIRDKSVHKPFQDCLLTRLLEPCLAHEMSKTAFIVNVSPEPEDEDELRRTMNFAADLTECDVKSSTRTKGRNCKRK
jgi:hypothetical protein